MAAWNCVSQTCVFLMRGIGRTNLRGAPPHPCQARQPRQKTEDGDRTWRRCRTRSQDDFGSGDGDKDSRTRENAYDARGIMVRRVTSSAEHPYATGPCVRQNPVRMQVLEGSGRRKTGISRSSARCCPGATCNAARNVSIFGPLVRPIVAPGATTRAARSRRSWQ